MLGLLVILLISWGLLFLIEKKSLKVIGIVPSPRRLRQFVYGIGLIISICLVLIFIETQLKAIKWQFQGINYSLLFDAFVYHLRSALTEDLVFRGALLYILMHRLGVKRGLLLSAIVFGVYHVFSYGILNERFILIAYVVVVTGFTGYVWAWAFYKTKSIYLGLGLHLGYNLVMSCFYESQPYGELLFTEISSVDLSEPMASFYSIFRGLFPSVLTFVALKFLLTTGLIEDTQIKENSK